MLVKEMEKKSKIMIDVISNKKNQIKKQDFKNIDWKKLLVQVSNNRVLYVFSKNLVRYDHLLKQSQREDLEKIIDSGQENINFLKKTLLFVKEILEKNNIDYVIFRTNKFLPFVTFDIDLLVKSETYHKTIEIFKHNGFRTVSHNKSLGGRLFDNQINLVSKKYLKIDLHKRCTWIKSFYLDEYKIFDDINFTKIEGIKVPTPNIEHEYIFNLCHALFERFYLTYLDYYCLKELSSRKKFNKEVIIKTAKKFNWLHAYNIFINETEKIDNFPHFFGEKNILRYLFFKFRSENYIDFIAFLYHYYSRIKYILNGKQKTPYYSHWFGDMSEI